MHRYREILSSVLRGVVVLPLCKAIEDDLRLHIHTKHLGHMQALNPKADMLRLLRLKT